MPSASITKRLLGETVKQLMQKQPLSKISVLDIAGTCGMNRNSFYYHFKDKYDLVNWVFYTALVAEIEKLDEELSGWRKFEFIFEFFYRDRQFYASALQEQGQNSFSEYFQSVVKQAIMGYAEELFSESEDREFFATFLVDSLLACITRWLSGGAKKSPAEMIRLIQLVFTGSATLMSEEPKQ